MRNIKLHLYYRFCLLILITGITNAAKAQSFFAKPGTFMVGCNYWASHSGTHMWRDWRPDIIDEDFKQLSDNGIKVLRVFPLWPDFQPIHQIYSGSGEKKYIAFQDEPLPQTEAGKNGVSELQLQHFEALADLAQKHHLKLVVGLVTGWMSGQLYVPPALEGKNILTDPESLAWQQKFVTTLVKRLKNKEAIAAWDFGNECDVMEKVQNHYQAFVWSSVISGAIRSADQTRPIVSGMHGLSPSEYGLWRIQDQAELTDVLTTHPYSLWTPYASQDGVNTIRTILHAAAETNMCADIGGKPCLTEETGVMGPMTGGEKERSAFARTALFSNWANDCKGTFWWCAYDQTKLAYPPYEFASVEHELGLIREDRSLKPVMGEFKAFSSFIDHLPFKELPVRKRDAVCILTENQENWPVAYSSYILAKQAGFDFQFQKAGQEIKDAKLYILPSIKGIDPVFRSYWIRLLDKVKQGASLYLSLDDAYLPSLTGPMGIEISTNIKRRGMIKYSTKLSSGDSLNFTLPAERKYNIDPKKAKVLALEPDGNPALIESVYGKGKIYLLTFPLEMDLAKTTGAFDQGQVDYASIYKTIAAPLISDLVISQPNNYIGVTEHAFSETEKVIVMVNYNPEKVVTPVKLKDGWKITGNYYGNPAKGNQVTINGNDAVVLSIKK